MIKSFDKQDCINYKQVIAKGCCSRSYKTGVCTVADLDGIRRHKLCSTKKSYCDYQKKEDTNVHT